MIERERPDRIIRFLFVGEDRSHTAREKNLTWENCPDEGVLCAKRLFSALREAGIEPREHDFVNVFDDDGNQQEIDVQGRVVVAMGQRVQQELIRRDIKFIPIVHPAARGAWCRQNDYTQMICEALAPENIERLLMGF